MKPSGIEWIGDIPDDWEVKRVKNTGKLIGGSAFPDEYQGVKNEEIPFIKVKSLAEDPISRNGKDSISESIRSKLNAEKFIIGSVVFAKVGAALLLQRFRILEFESCIDNNMMGFIPLVIEPRFFKYVTVLFDFSYFVNPGTVPSINQEQIGNIKIPFPPLKTQQKIADYLDEKCGEIDATIAKQKESIEKLKAYKQSLISETVTKGLDKSAPLKPSGIEWIGDIPDDWEVTKISRLYSIQLGKMLQPEKKSLGDTYEPYICAANLSSGTFRLDEVKYMWISEPEKDIYRLKRDDLLVTEGGDVGISSIWKDDISPCYFQNALHRVVPKKGNSNRFLHYWLIVLKSVGYIDLICNKSTIAHFTKEKFAQSLILSIPLQTQEKIADYLDSKCSQIDKYITEKQNIIQKLDAYKKSLIFECVTGKQKI